LPEGGVSAVSWRTAAAGHGVTADVAAVVGAVVTAGVGRLGAA
jgi:hypothetical protein